MERHENSKEMKKLLVILVISLFPLCCIHSGNRSGFGVKAGLSYTTISGWRMTKYKTSGFIGGTYSIEMKNNWYFQPELLFSNIGSNLKDDKTILSGGHIGIYGIETPVNISYRPSLNRQTNMIFDIGMYSFIGLFGKKEYKYYESPTINDSPFDAIKRFNVGINLGVGMKYKAYSTTVSFQRGLTDLSKNGGGIYHQSFRLSIGYYF